MIMNLKILLLYVLCLTLTGCDDKGVKHKGAQSLEQQSQAVEKMQDYSQCPDIMKYKVGNYVFGLPRDSYYVREYTALNQPLSRSERPCDEVMELTAFRYGPNEFSKYKKDRGSILQIRVRFHDQALPSDVYEAFEVLEKLQKANLTLNDLPKENGFYKFEFKGSQFLFIADNNGIKTKLGNPLTFSCLPSNYNRKTFNCGTGFPWKDNLSLGVTLNTEYFPVSSWSGVYDELQEFAENLIIKETESEE